MTHAFPIRNDHDLDRAVSLVSALWDAAPGTPEADVLEVMAALINAYERSRRALPPADPRALIDFKLRELSWTQRELGRRLGWGSGRVSEVLSGKRPLTLSMVRHLAEVLAIPPGALVADAHGPDDGRWVRLPPALRHRLEARVGVDPDACTRFVLDAVAAALGAIEDRAPEPCAAYTDLGGDRSNPPHRPRGLALAA